MTPLSRYTSIAVALHWAIALLIIFQLAGGLLMTKLQISTAIKFDLYQMHKSFGLSVLALSLLRLGWRFMHRPPALPEAMPNWQKRIARLTHVFFYFLIILMPLTGWLMVSISPREIPTFFFGLFHVPHLPITAVLETSEASELLFRNAHEYLAWGTIGLLALHIGAALKHRFVDRDDVFPSMAIKKASEGIMIIMVFAALFAGVLFYSLNGQPTALKEATDKTQPLIQEITISTQTQDQKVSSSWTLDPEKSSLKFIAQERGREFTGEFKTFSANIQFDPANVDQAKIDVTVDTSSFMTSDGFKNSEAPSGEWFDVANHPEARFESTNVVSTGGNSYEATGTLSIKGISKEIVLPFELVIDGERAKAKGGVGVIRTDYALGAASNWLDSEGIALDVRIEFEIEADFKG